ncbi:uncharacterized protein [Ptychodera flava]|uniref:uncharacterized protein n=1 Tax=Ptychodera flava TaxID=63121 RepID=UPI003969D928
MATDHADEVSKGSNIQNHADSSRLAISRTFTRRQKLTLLSISLAYLADFVSFSILAPFYPAKFHLDTTAIGLMFLIISASYTIASFFWGYITDKFDIPKLMMILARQNRFMCSTSLPGTISISQYKKPTMVSNA